MREAIIGTKLFDRRRWERLADGLALAVVVALPWSTSAVGILIVCWLAALLPTLELAALRRELASAAGGLPVMLWLLAAIGTLWADAGWSERVHALQSYHKLLLIPLLLVQFRRSDKAWHVITGFLLSCAVLLAVSWVFVAAGVRLPGLNVGVPVKDYISQSGLFTISAFVLAYLAIDYWQQGRIVRALLVSLLALLFLINIGFVASGRTALVISPLLLVLLAVLRFGRKGVFGVLAAGLALGAIGWNSSSYLRDRTTSIVTEVRSYGTENAVTSGGLRLEFYRKSVDFIAEAPLLGHGTGSIKPLFQRSIVGQTGLAGMFAANPHQQTLAVAIQLGLVGAALLWAMWIAHLLLFRGGAMLGWFGLVVVVQNIVGSLFNSHLFDFTQGWTYVLGVGVAGGAMLRSASVAPAAASPAMPGPDAASGRASQLPL